MMSDEWLTSGETIKLKQEMATQLIHAQQRLLGAAGMSSDPKCAELAREIRVIEHMIKLLEGTRDDKQRHG